MYRDYMGMTRVREEGGESETHLAVDDRVVNARRVLHGGAMCDLLDAAIASAVRSALPGDRRAVTATLTVEFLRPVPEGSRLIAYGHALHVGRNLAVGRAEALFDGKLAASASGLWKIIAPEEAVFRPR